MLGFLKPQHDLRRESPMNNMINGILRAVVPAVLAYAAGKGYITQGAAAEIGAAIITIAAGIWSVTSNTSEKK